MENGSISIGNKKKAKFKVDSKLITQILGSEIIESHSIAFAEQIKNSKDAGATKVIVDLSKIRNDIITIEDNGSGMTSDEIEKDWFLLGSSKKDLDSATSGGKGIGRLSLFKIGKSFKIETFSKKEVNQFSISEKELIEKDAEDFEVDIISNRDGSKEWGTKISISNLDSNIYLDELEVELENLQSSNNSMDIEIIYPQDFNKTTFLKPSEILDVVPFYANIEIDCKDFSGIESVNYSFKANMGNEIIYENSVILPNLEKQIVELCEKKSKALSIGKVKFDLKNFFFDRGVGDYIPSVVNGKNIQKYFLKVYQGINIYRNGFKIYGHGSEDWLKLAENRLARTGENIDNKMTFGVIYLDDEESLLLREKSSREGFIRDSSSRAFREIILLLVKQFGQDTANAKKEIKNRIKDIKLADTKKKANGNVPENQEINFTSNNTGKQHPIPVINDNSNKATTPSSDNDVQNGSGRCILKQCEEIIENGSVFHLKNPDLFEEADTAEKIVVTYPKNLIVDGNAIVQSENSYGDYNIEYILGNKKENFTLTIKKRNIINNKKKEEFFKDSRQFLGDIDLSDINDLVNQLEGLNYDRKYLLYVVSLRAILEDLVTEYIGNREELGLEGNLQGNVETVIDDLLKVIQTNKKDEFYDIKVKIHEKFKGFKSLKNFLAGIKVKFKEESYDQFLHSLTHNPTKIEKSFALEIANQMILPLYVLIKCLKDEGVFNR